MFQFKTDAKATNHTTKRPTHFILREHLI